MAADVTASARNKYGIFYPTYPFFWIFKKVIESPYPLNASSSKIVMLFDRRSKCRKRCRGRKASLGMWWILLSPKRRYCRFSSVYRNQTESTSLITETTSREKEWNQSVLSVSAREKKVTNPLSLTQNTWNKSALSPKSYRFRKIYQISYVGDGDDSKQGKERKKSMKKNS